MSAETIDYPSRASPHRSTRTHALLHGPTRTPALDREKHDIPIDNQSIPIDNRAMKSSIIAWSRAALVTLGLGTLLLQGLIVLQAKETGFLFPEVEHLVAPYTITGVASVLAVQIGLFALWMIVEAVARGNFYETPTLRWINVLRGATVPATIIPSLTALHLLAVVGIGGPGVILALLATLASGAAAFIFVTLARQVYLAQAAEHAELEAVI